MSKKKTLTFVIPNLSNGGAEKALINVALYLFHNNKDLNIQILTASPERSGINNIPDELKCFCLNSRSAVNLSSLFSNVAGIAKYVKENEPDIMISTSGFLNFAVLLARRVSGRKFRIIISQQVNMTAYLKELRLPNRILLNTIHKLISKAADKIICTSEGVAADFKKRYNNRTLSERLHIIYNPVYNELLPKLANETPNDIDLLAKKGTRIISVGRLVKQKDHPTLLKAFSQLLKEMPQAYLYIAGAGSQEEKLKNLTASLSIKENVIFLGYKENPFAYISRCDLFVLSSTYEGFGNVIVEAMSCGINVVSTDCPDGPAEILDNGKFGYLSPVADPVQLSKQMKIAIENKIAPAVLIERAKFFSVENISKQYLQQVNTLLR